LFVQIAANAAPINANPIDPFTSECTQNAPLKIAHARLKFGEFKKPILSPALWLPRLDSNQEPFG
tara:strand:- start:9 stop:203 length:195 start_codon:yes stop_codon:yes gene_type:complete